MLADRSSGYSRRKPMTKPIKSFDLDRDLEEWTDEELNGLAEALMETDSQLGA